VIGDVDDGRFGGVDRDAIRFTDVTGAELFEQGGGGGAVNSDFGIALGNKKLAAVGIDGERLGF